MLSRLKGAIDRTIAEEQARQKAHATPGDGPAAEGLQRSGSDRDSTRRSRASKPSIDTSKNAPGGTVSIPDPDTFAASFTIDDEEDEPAPATEAKTSGRGLDTAKSTAPQDDGGKPEEKPAAATNDVEHGAQPVPDSKQTNGNDGHPPTGELPPQVQKKLKRLVKLEDAYRKLHASYRTAHTRATAVEPFERTLREHTPLTSIKDPQALVEYLQSLKANGDMIKDEFRRVSTERDTYKKSSEEAEKENARLKEELATLKTQKDKEQAHQADDELKQQLETQLQATKSELEAKTAEALTLTVRAKKQEEKYATLKALYEKAIHKVAEVENNADMMVEQNSELDRQYKELAGAKSEAARELAETKSKLNDLETAYGGIESRIRAEIATLEEAKAMNEAQIKELTSQAMAVKSIRADEASMEDAASESAVSTQASGGKKKNRKKKKGGAGAGAGAGAPDNAGEEGKGLEAAPVPVGDADVIPLTRAKKTAMEEALQAFADQLRGVTKDSDEGRLQAKREKEEKEEKLSEEVDNLRGSLAEIGHDHVQAKNKIKALEAEKETLSKRIIALELEVKAAESAAKDGTKAQAENESLKREFEKLKAESSTLQSDLDAAQHLAQTRYKDLSDLKEVVAKTQPELKSLRQDSAALKTTKQELAAKNTEIRNLEKREKDLEAELTRAQRLAGDRETDIKSLREKLTTETNARLRLEDEKRTAGRDLRRAEADKIELSAKEEKTARELQRVQDELTTLRPSVKELEDERARLKAEADVLREEVELKMTKYFSAQNVLSSMRDQMAELRQQLKETQKQLESREEGLADAEKMLSDRTSESDKMLNMLSESDTRNEDKTRDLQARLDAAVDERDRLEERSSTEARKRSREAEELRNQLREREREVRTLTSDKEEYEQKERDWRRRLEDLDQVEQRAAAEVAEMRETVSNLEKTLNVSQEQVAQKEKQRADLKRVLDEQRSRYEKLARELKAAQDELATVLASAGVSKTVRTTLLQFLEAKNPKIRADLVPVVGKMLGFYSEDSKDDKKRWQAAVQNLLLR